MIAACDAGIACGNFAQAAAEHFAGTPVIFEVWHEPDAGHTTQPGPGKCGCNASGLGLAALLILLKPKRRSSI